MKHKIALYALVPLLAAGMFGTQAASAHGMGGMGRGIMFGGFGKPTPDEIATRQQAIFTYQAQLLGISVEEVKAAWAEGKTLPDLVKEKGISNTDIEARMESAYQEQLNAQLQALVEKGVITQAQADKRLQSVQKQTKKPHGRISKDLHRGKRF